MSRGVDLGGGEGRVGQVPKVRSGGDNYQMSPFPKLLLVMCIL